MAINQDYLKFNAQSIKDAILKKLADSPTFTDQVFEDSNLAVLVDIFAHQFEVSQYYINHAASETLFADTQIYENMNRLVKLLGYNPTGNETSISTVNVANASTNVNVDGKRWGSKTSYQCTIPRYTAFKTGNTDDNGNPVYYSVNSDTYIYNSAKTQKITLYNGRWKLYTKKSFVAAGSANESFNLGQLDDADILAYPYVKIYIRRNGTIEGKEPWTPVMGTLLGNSGTIVSPTSRKFELRMNEDKQYVITFGDGIHGKKLVKGDELIVIYLNSNGKKGEVPAGYLTEGITEATIGVDGMDIDVLLFDILQLSEGDYGNYLVSSPAKDGTEILGLNDAGAPETTWTMTNINNSTMYAEEEDVSEIRANAPVAFRNNSRLLTENDFRWYVKSKHYGAVRDVYVMNNWEYMTTFYTWFNNQVKALNTVNEYDMQKYISGLKKYGYTFADACDFNNVYIWMWLKQPSYDIREIARSMQDVKVMTAEPVPLRAIEMSVVLAAGTPTNYTFGNSTTDGNKPSTTYWTTNNVDKTWIEIIRDRNSIVPVETLKNKVITIIRNFFKPENLSLGMTLDVSSLYNKIVAEEGVYDVQMVRLNDNGELVRNTGLSFMTWANTTIFADWKNDGKISPPVVEQFGSLYSYLPFMYPKFLDNLESQVKVLFETTNTQDIEF